MRNKRKKKKKKKTEKKKKNKKKTDFIETYAYACWITMHMN